MVWFAGVNWDDIKGTDRSLVEATHHPVVWVDRGSSPLRGGRWWPATHAGTRVIRRDPLLVRFTPVVPPFNTRPGLRRLTALLIRWQTRAAVRRVGLQPRVVVVTHLIDVLGMWRDEAVHVLFGTDDYVAGAELMGLSRRWLARLERKCVAAADVVLAISEDLASKWGRYRSEPVRVLRNGCRVLPDSDPRAVPTTPATPIDGPPVAGLVGQLSSRIDIEVLVTLAHAGFRLLLVGPVDPSWEPERFAELVQHDRVEYVGRVPAEDLPTYFDRMQVGLTPYVDTDFNRASFPLKTLEYLGAGLPVVASDIAPSRWVLADMANVLGAEEAERHFALAKTPADFVEQVQRLGREGGPALRRRRKEFAKRHSWAARVRELDQAIAGVRNRRSTDRVTR